MSSCNFAFYRNGKLGFALAPTQVEGVYFKMLEDNPDRYFTADGFFYPLSGTGVSASDVLNGKIPLFESSRHSSTPSYVYVTKEGSLNQLDIIKRCDEEWTLDLHALPQGDGVSYVIGRPNAVATDLFIGALAAWGGEEKFQADTDAMAIVDNRKIFWFTIEEIQAKIQALYDKEHPNEDTGQGDTPKTQPGG